MREVEKLSERRKKNLIRRFIEYFGEYLIGNITEYWEISGYIETSNNDDLRHEQVDYFHDVIDILQDLRYLGNWEKEQDQNEDDTTENQIKILRRCGSLSVNYIYKKVESMEYRMKWYGKLKQTKPIMFLTEESQEEKKCGHCNWRTSRFYGYAKTKDDAIVIYQDTENGEDYGLGLCPECMIQLLVEEKIPIG